MSQQYDLRQLLTNGNAHERSVAAEALGKLGYADIVPELIEQLRQAERLGEVRAAVEALSHFTDTRMTAVLLETVATKSWWGYAANLAAHQLYDQIASILARIGDKEQLIAALDHEHSQVRRVAAKAIGNLDI